MSETNLVKTCPYCQSEDIVYRIKVTSRNGYPVQLGVQGIFSIDEQIYAEMCQGCGSIVRTYVLNPYRDWKKD